MGRYDRNRSKESSKTPFIMIPIVISLIIGVGGIFYVMDNFKNLKETEATVSDKMPSNEIVATEGYPDKQQSAEDERLEFLPAEPESLASNDTQSSTQQSDLPDLLSSDNYVRQALVNISPGFAQWLKTDQIIRKYVFIANDFAQGLRILKHMSFLRLAEPFSVEQDKNGPFIAAKSFQRYDQLAQTIHAIDTESAVALYQKIRPLMLQVFAEFSYPRDITLESIVKKAAAEILTAPALEGQVTLIRPSVHYKFADAKLETLNPIQKQMIRMGPENTRIIQNKCREFLVELAKSGL
ncbi:DUF3014 domain-containing protein [Methyloglobulus sp.]|uniref:DUF3014 domain-containing protein n=1 Tax=Methyloglobulus sp. TaxID=2518622 RepID=UPI00398A0D81